MSSPIILNAAGLTTDDVTIEYKSEAAEVVSVLAQDPEAIGVLPQPFATVACQQNDSLQMVSDLTAEWDATGQRLFGYRRHRCQKSLC